MFTTTAPPSAINEVTDYQPALDQWSDLLTENRKLTDAFALALPTVNISRLRCQLLEAAHAYTGSLRAIASEAGIPAYLPSRSREASKVPCESTPLVMTGHQPTIFHPGIAAKYRVTENFCQEVGATNLAVIIDTDIGEGGEFLRPQKQNHQLRIDKVSFGEGSGMYRAQQLRNRDALLAAGAKAAAGLNELGYFDQAQAVSEATDRYALLAPNGIVEANTIVRRSYGIGDGSLEIPLSQLAQLPESRRFFAAIIQDAENFAVTYNHTLHEFRRKRKIRNSANPFPDLLQHESTVELPYWAVNLQTNDRQPLSVQLSADTLCLHTPVETICEFTKQNEPFSLDQLDETWLIVPRGALISAFFRLVASDLFVHGTGGGKYDRFTDDFLQAYWSVEPPAFTVATASRYLFQDELEESRALKNYEIKLRDMISNTARYLGTGVFLDSVEQKLDELNAEKMQLVESLKLAKREGRSAATFGMRIQQIGHEIEETVRCAFPQEAIKLVKLTSQLLKLYETREFPFFYFDNLDVG